MKFYNLFSMKTVYFFAVLKFYGFFFQYYWNIGYYQEESRKNTMTTFWIISTYPDTKLSWVKGFKFVHLRVTPLSKEFEYGVHTFLTELENLTISVLSWHAAYAPPFFFWRGDGWMLFCLQETGSSYKHKKSFNKKTLIDMMFLDKEVG